MQTGPPSSNSAGSAAGTPADNAPDNFTGSSSARASPDLTQRKAGWLVAALTAFALVVRLIGIDHQLPHRPHPDARVWTSQVARARGVADPLVDNFARFYPDLLPRVCALATEPVELPPGASADEHRAAAGTEILRLRILGMLVALFAIPATYRIARAFLGRRPAVFAAALAATSMMVHWYSQQARPHAAAGGFAAAALVLILAARRRPGLLRWSAAGLACAAALATLQSAAALLPAFFAAAVLSERTASILGRFGSASVGLLLVLLALPFQPSLGQSGAAPESSTGSELSFFGHRISTSSFDGSGFATLFQRALEIDPIILVLVLLGIVTLLIQRPVELFAGRRRRDVLVLLAFALPYAFAIGIYARSFDRFLIPLMPIAALLAAGGLFGWKRSRRIAVAAAISIVALQAVCDLRISAWRAKPDTIEQAARWIESRVESGDGPLAMLPYIDVPVLRSPASLSADARQRWEARNAWQRYLEHVSPAELEARGYRLTAVPLPRNPDERRAVAADPAPFVGAIDARYVIVSRMALAPEVDAKLEQDFIRLLQAQVARRGTRVARISPWRGDVDDPPVAWTGASGPAAPLWIWRVLQMRSPGPMVEIWRF